MLIREGAHLRGAAAEVEHGGHRERRPFRELLERRRRHADDGVADVIRSAADHVRDVRQDLGAVDARERLEPLLASVGLPEVERVREPWRRHAYERLRRLEEARVLTCRQHRTKRPFVVTEMLERLGPAVCVDESLQTRRIRLRVQRSEDGAAAEVDRGRDAAAGDSAAAAAATSRALRGLASSSPLPLLLSPLSSLLPQSCRGDGFALRRVAVAVQARLASDVRVHWSVLVHESDGHSYLTAAPYREARVRHHWRKPRSAPVPPTTSPSSSSPASEPLSCTAECQLGGTNVGAALLIVPDVGGLAEPNFRVTAHCASRRLSEWRHQS